MVLASRINLSQSVVRWDESARVGWKWDKQFYLELAQLLPQQLSTLISRFLHKGKVEFGNLLSPLLSHSCSADRRWWRSLVESGEGEGETAGAP